MPGMTSTASKEKMEYWLENALKGALGNSPSKPSSNKTWLGSVRAALNPFRRSSLVLDQFQGVSTPCRIMISGLDCAGKTTLLHRHVSRDPKGGDIETRIPFIGVNFEEARYDDLGLAFHAYETGGCTTYSYRRLERAVWQKGNARVWVIDSWDRDRLLESVEELAALMGHAKLYGVGAPADEEIPGWRGNYDGAPLLILLNKDLSESSHAADCKPITQVELMQKYARVLFDKMAKETWSIHVTDFHSGQGVEKAFKWLGGVLKDKAESEQGSSCSVETVWEKAQD